MIITEFEQGSQEWLDCRIGVLTGTKIKQIITPAKLEASKSYKDTLYQLIDESFTAISGDSQFSSKAMDEGTEKEPIARRAYIEKTGIKINEHGLCLSDKNNLHGCSADGFTDDFKGGIEIKCPSGKVHLKYMIDGGLPQEHKLQVVNMFLVNEKLEWVDFVSFRPEFYPAPLFVKRVFRSELEKEINSVQSAIDNFFIEYNLLIDKFSF